MIDDVAYHCLLTKIYEKHGYDFRDFARSSVKRRIASFMHRHHIEASDDLSNLIFTKEDSLALFIQELSVTVTEMFRNPSFFRRIRELIVPRLKTYPSCKIWMAGCATGQEVYSLAILLREEGLAERTMIYATDINPQSIAVAKEGLYHLEDMQRYTTNYQNAGGKSSFANYYTARFDFVLFDKSLRDNVVFAVHNLATDGSFHEFQLIICRNVLMYFNHQLQSRVLSLFHESLCPLGMLGLGDKESLLFSDNKHYFAAIDRKEKLYMKVK